MSQDSIGNLLKLYSLIYVLAYSDHIVPNGCEVGPTSSKIAADSFKH